MSIKDLPNNRLLIADDAHRTNVLTIDLNTIIALAKPSAMLISELPYQTGIDGTAALVN